ncbi:MAG: hypothetical protein QOG67_4038 [Verrucomicrobiota bacterium]|jgi:hypothetical protein
MSVASTADAQTQTVTWSADSTSSFDVTISGTGQLNSDSGSYVFTPDPAISPSGLWQVFDGTQAIWPSSLDPNLWEIAGGGGVNFLPTHADPFNPDLGFPTYHDFKLNVLPVQDGNSASFGYLHDAAGWSANESFSITSEPDPNDPSTWTFVARTSGSGPTLAVPEPATWIMFGIGVSLLAPFRVLRRRIVKPRSESDR